MRKPRNSFASYRLTSNLLLPSSARHVDLPCDGRPNRINNFRYCPMVFLRVQRRDFCGITVGVLSATSSWERLPGFRNVPSTAPNESSLFNRDWIERQLAHIERNGVRRAY